MFIPSCFVSYHGAALDEKTPLLRSGDALSREGVRLLAKMGYQVRSPSPKPKPNPNPNPNPLSNY